MAEQPETPKVLDELSKSNSAKPSGRAERQKRTALKRISLILVFISPLLLIVFFLAYMVWGLREDMQQLSAENTQLNAVITTDNDRVQQLEAMLNETSSLPTTNELEINQLESQFQNEVGRLNSTIAELRAQLEQPQATGNQNWQLAEVEYLLRTANQRLQIDQDVASAIALLQSADAILRDAQDSRSFPLREAIRVELTQLAGVNVVDVEAVWLRLVAAITTIEELPQAAITLPDFQSRLNSPATEATAPSAERGIVQASLDFLGSVFVWRHWEDSPDVMLQPGQQLYLKQNLVSLLEQAQLALLQGEAAIYSNSLERSLVILSRASVTQDERWQTLAAELERLQGIDLSVAVPDISRSLNLVRQLNADTGR